MGTNRAQWSSARRRACWLLFAPREARNKSAVLLLQLVVGLHAAHQRPVEETGARLRPTAMTITTTTNVSLNPNDQLCMSMEPACSQAAGRGAAAEQREPVGTTNQRRPTNGNELAHLHCPTLGPARLNVSHSAAYSIGSPTEWRRCSRSAEQNGSNGAFGPESGPNASLGRLVIGPRGSRSASVQRPVSSGQPETS